MQATSDTAYSLRLIQQKAAHDADQTEFCAVRMGNAPIEEGIRDDRASGQIDDAIADDSVPWDARSNQIDSLTGRAAEEISRRAALLGRAYPFIIDGSSLRYRKSADLVYEFCLAVSVSPSLSEGRLKQLPVVFERLARDVMIVYAGSTAAGMRTGWPRDEIDKLPARAKQLFGIVRERCGEWTWCPEPDYAEDPEPKYVKDLGLDALVWLPMADSRPGQLFLIGQCACGRTDWDSKLRELDLDKLARWFRPFPAPKPFRCFLVPFHIPNEVLFREVNDTAGLTFDRARITLVAKANRKLIQSSGRKYFAKLLQIVVEEVERTAPKRPRKLKCDT